MKDLILLGPYGSGKTTQAQRLARAKGYIHFGAGQALRDFTKQDSPEATELRNLMAQGELVPAHYTVGFLREAIAENPGVRFIIDGLPRSMDQFDLLEQAFADLGRQRLPLLINISDEESLRRQIERRTCGSCGFGTTPAELACPACGSTAVVVRPDNDPQIAKHRIDIYHEETDPVIAAYRGQGTILEVNGEQPVDGVTHDILSALGEHSAPVS